MTTPTTYQMEKENAALKAENKALREAAGALIDGIAEHIRDLRNVCGCEAREEGTGCEGCLVIATRRLDGPDGQIDVDLCDACAEDHIAEGWTEIDEFPFTGPLITLRALITLRKLLEAP